MYFYMAHRIPEPAQPPVQYFAANDGCGDLQRAVPAFDDFLILRQRRFQQVCARATFDSKAQADALAFTKAEMPVFVEAFEIELRRSGEGQAGCRRRQNAMQCQAALIFEITVAADQIKAYALLDQAQRHDFDL